MLWTGLLRWLWLLTCMHLQGSITSSGGSIPGGMHQGLPYSLQCLVLALSSTHYRLKLVSSNTQRF